MRLSGEVAIDPSTSTGELETMDPSINHTMTYDTVLVKSSLSEGTDLKGSDARGWTHLHFAASQGDMEGAKSLIDAAASKAHYERDSLMQVVAPPYDHELLNARDNGGRSPLTIAIRSQQPKMSLLLIEKGAAIDLRDYYGKSPIFNAILFNDETTLDALLGQNCDLSFVGRDGGTILHTAAQSATISIIERLEAHLRQLKRTSLALGLLSVNARDEEGRTAKEYIGQDDEARAEAFLRLMKSVEQCWDNVSPQKGKEPLASMTFALPVVIGAFWFEVKGERAKPAARYQWYQYFFISLLVLVWVYVAAVYLDIFFSWHRVAGAGLKFLRGPVSNGMTRISWVCVSQSSGSPFDSNANCNPEMWTLF